MGLRPFEAAGRLLFLKNLAGQICNKNTKLIKKYTTCLECVRECLIKTKWSRDKDLCKWWKTTLYSSFWRFKIIFMVIIIFSLQQNYITLYYFKRIKIILIILLKNKYILNMCLN